MPTITPNIDNEGNFLGASITERPQFHHGLAPEGFAIDEATGNSYYLEDPYEAERESIFDDNEYIDLILEANPELPNALRHAVDFWTEEELDAYNEAIESDDLDVLNDAIQGILAAYEQSKLVDSKPAPAQVQEEPEGEADLSPLYQAEANEDLVQQFQEFADASEGAQSYIAELSARFHAGEATAEQLITEAMGSELSTQDLVSAYKQMLNY